MVKARLVSLFIGIFLIGSVLFPVPALAGVGVTPSSLSFGSVTMNTTSGTMTVVVANNTPRSITIHQVSSNLPEFLITGTALPISLAPQASTSFQVAFRPDAAVTYNGQIVVKTNIIWGGTVTIPVSGAGTNPQTQSYLLSSSAS